MAFREIIGQEKAVNILKGCIRRNRIPHAMLFAGDEGIGKRLTALNFAKALNCRGTGGVDLFFADMKESGAPDAGDIDACDRCPSCTKTDRACHPDVFVIRPEGDGGQITVPAIRRLEESLSYKPFEGRWKVAIIDNADRLNQSASNAFLQTLEEPAPRSILILITSRPDVMLATIRSRCQRINFTPLPVNLMQELLKERLEKSDGGKSTLLSVLSGGRLGHALDESLIAQRDRSFEIFRKMLGRLEEDAWDDRDEMEKWFDWGEMWLRDIAVFKATARADFLINRDREHEIREICRGAALKDILKLARELYNIKRKLDFNLNRQLTFNYTAMLLKKMLGRRNN